MMDGNLFMPFHVKITRHFVERSRDYMQPGDVLRLWEAIEDGSLHHTVHRRRGQFRVAIRVGSVFVVATIQDGDDGIVTLLTVLTKERSDCVRRRRDTVFAELSTEKPFRPRAA